MKPWFGVGDSAAAMPLKRLNTAKSALCFEPLSKLSIRGLVVGVAGDHRSWHGALSEAPICKQQP